MHHFRGSLRDGTRSRLDPANVYIEFDPAPAGGPIEGWRGYLLVPSEGDLEAQGSYTLTLADGRSGTLTIDHVSPEPSGKFRAYFIGDGPLK